MKGSTASQRLGGSGHMNLTYAQTKDAFRLKKANLYNIILQYCIIYTYVTFCDAKPLYTMTAIVDIVRHLMWKSDSYSFC